MLVQTNTSYFNAIWKLELYSKFQQLKRVFQKGFKCFAA